MEKETEYDILKVAIDQIKNSNLKPSAVRFIEDWKCPKCNDGEMRPTHTILFSNPPQSQHLCSKCGHVESLYMNELK